MAKTNERSCANCFADDICVVSESVNGWLSEAPADIREVIDEGIIQTAVLSTLAQGCVYYRKERDAKR